MKGNANSYPEFEDIEFYKLIIRQLLDQISKRDRRLLWLEAEQERSARQVAEKEQAVQALTAQVAEKEQAVQALTAQVAEKEQAVANLQARLAETNQTITERDQMVAALQERLAESEQRVAEMKGLAAEKEQLLSSIAASRGWKLLLLLWRLRLWLVPRGSKRENVLRQVWRGLRLWRREGLFALVRRTIQEVARSIGRVLLSSLQPLKPLARRFIPLSTRRRILSFIRNEPSQVVTGLLSEGQLPVVGISSMLIRGSSSTSPLLDCPRLLSTRCFRVLYIAPDPKMPSHYYRVQNHSEYLQAQGIHADFVQHFYMHDFLPEIAKYDLVVIFRTIRDALLDQVFFRCRKAGVPVVYDIDDLVFDPLIVVPKYVDGLRFLSADDRQRYLESVPKFREALLASDYCTATTDFLADYIRGLGKTTFVLRNGFSDAAIRLSEAALQLKRAEEHAGVVIGYMSGTKTHQKDFAVVSRPLARIMSEFREVTFNLVGDLDLDEFPELQPFASRIQAGPAVPRDKLPETIASVDINLAPLEIGNPYCEAKSELKYFGAAAVKVPTIASATGTYRQVIKHGLTGFLATTEAEWYEALKLLITQPELRRTIGEAAYRHVMDAYHPDTLAKRLKDVYSQILDASRQSLGATEKTLSISFVSLPYIKGSGGQNNIISIGRELARQGHEVRIYIDGSDEQVETSRRAFEKEGVFDFLRFGGSPADMVCCDALVATHWKTAYIVKELEQFCARTFYFVQDYEPYFHPMGTDYIRADRTYDLGLYVISFGPWCLSEIRKKHQCEGDWIPFFIDHNMYDASPSDWRSRRRVLVFARPQMERRCFSLAVEALAAFTQRFNLKERGFELALFGGDYLGSLPFEYVNLGILPSDRLPELYRTGRLGMVITTTNMSMVGYEMMAFGCPVVDLDLNDNAALYGGRHNVILAEPDAVRIAETMAKALNDTDRLEEIARNAYQFAKTVADARLAAEAFERIILRELEDAALTSGEVSLAKKQELELVQNISLPKETLAICPVCGDPRSALVFTKEDTNFGGLLQLVQCGGCSLVYLNPRLTPEASNSLENQSPFYRFSPETIEQKIGLLREMALSLEKFSPRRGRVLDIGCNRGLLLEAMRQVGWQVVGVEPSLTAADEARANFGLEIYGELDDVLALEPFDMAIAWHVLEHTYEPVEFLRQSAKVLCPDGVLVLQVPSFEYLEEFERRGSITGLVCAVHNFYFTPTTLRLVLKKAGLEPVYLVSQPSDLALTAVCRKPST